MTPRPGEATIGDMLGHPGMRKVLAIWTPLIAIMVAGAALTVRSPWEIPAGLLYGLFAYSFLEYLTHRYLYHWEPRERLWRAINSRLGPPHLRHHERPTHWGGAVMFNQVPIVLAVLACLGVLLVLPLPLAFTFATIAASSLGFVLHEMVHFGCHQLPMRHPVLAYLKRRHLFHHYRDENVNFGTTSPIWDIVLGTNHVPGKRSRARPFRHREENAEHVEARD